MRGSVWEWLCRLTATSNSVDISGVLADIAPAVQRRIDRAVAAERKRIADLVEDRGGMMAPGVLADYIRRRGR